MIQIDGCKPLCALVLWRRWRDGRHLQSRQPSFRCSEPVTASSTPSCSLRPPPHMPHTSEGPVILAHSARGRSEGKHARCGWSCARCSPMDLSKEQAGGSTHYTGLHCHVACRWMQQWVSSSQGMYFLRDQPGLMPHAVTCSTYVHVCMQSPAGGGVCAFNLHRDRTAMGSVHRALGEEGYASRATSDFRRHSVFGILSYACS